MHTYAQVYHKNIKTHRIWTQINNFVYLLRKTTMRKLLSYSCMLSRIIFFKSLYHYLIIQINFKNYCEKSIHPIQQKRWKKWTIWSGWCLPYLKANWKQIDSIWCVGCREGLQIYAYALPRKAFNIKKEKWKRDFF